jgi:hypothetical protein
LAEEYANGFKRGLVEDPFATERLGQNLCSEVISRGAQTAGNQHHVCTTRRAPERICHFFRVIEHRGLKAGFDFNVVQALRHQGLVRVDDFAAQDFVTDREDFCP